MQDAERAAPHRPLHRLWRDPLVHVLALGALLFGADALLASRRDDPRLIVIGPEVVQEAREVFRGAAGREPGEQDMRILRQRWIDNEVLYREGLALQLDRGDAAIRERVIFKTLNMLQSGLALPPVDEAGLRAWFAQRRADYDTPARFDFREAVLAAPSRQALQRFADALNAGKPADAEGGLRIFRERPRANLLASYGEPFTQALERLPPGRWQLLDSRDGPRVVRLDRIEPGARADFDSLRERLLQDWRDATMQELRTAAVRELAKKYTVREQGGAR